MESFLISGSYHLTCPLCEAGELRFLGHGSTRCDSCGYLLGEETLRSIKNIISLPDALGHHACECGHPEMRLLPDGVFRCPACGLEVLPPQPSEPG